MTPEESRTSRPASQGSKLADAAMLATLVGVIVILVVSMINMREVRRLKERGATVHTASINLPDRALERMTPAEREEFEATWYVKKAGLAGALAAHLAFVVTHPVRYASSLLKALHLAGSRPGAQ